MEVQAISWSICLDEIKGQKYIELFALDTQHAQVYATLFIDEEEELGGLQALLAKEKISPYQWISLVSCHPLSEARTSQGSQYTVGQITSVPDPLRPLFPLRVMYLDLEVISDDRKSFPSALRARDYIFMASMILDLGEGTLIQHLFLIGGGIELPGVIAHSCVDELELLRCLVDVWSNFNPQTIVTYNGETFDLPYLRNRLLRYPEISLTGMSILIETSPLRERVIHTPFGTKRVSSLLPVGVESFDLLLYFRLSHPWLKDKKLDTVSGKLLQERKTGLAIDRLWENAVSGDAERLKENASYSLQDVRLLVPLYRQAWNEVLPLCQEARILLADLLTEPVEELVTRIVYTLDPNCINLHLPYHYCDHTDVLRPGLYRPMYAYNYTSLYAEALLASENELTQHLGRVVSKAPPVLRYACFKSRYPAKDAYQYFSQALREKLPSSVVMMTPYVFYSSEHCDTFPLVATYNLFWILKEGGVISQEDDAFSYQGAHPFTFPFARRHIEALLIGMKHPLLEEASERELTPDRSKMAYSHSQAREIIAKLPVPS